MSRAAGAFRSAFGARGSHTLDRCLFNLARFSTRGVGTRWRYARHCRRAPAHDNTPESPNAHFVSANVGRIFFGIFDPLELCDLCGLTPGPRLRIVNRGRLMTYLSQIEDRIRFLRVDESTLPTLRPMRQLFEASIDDLLENFYVHILQQPELKSLFANEEAVARARSAQKHHWLNTLFTKTFGKAQFDRSEQIGLAHVRVGLTPSWYMGSYCYMLNQFIDLVAQHSRDDLKSMTEMVRALNKSVFLDMSFVIDSYLEAKDSVTREMLQRASRFGADVQRLNAPLADAAEALDTRARALASRARPLNEGAIQAQEALKRASLAMRAASPALDASTQDREDILMLLNEASNQVAGLIAQADLVDKESHGVLASSGQVSDHLEKLRSRLDKARVDDRFSYPDLPRSPSSTGGDVFRSEQSLLIRIRKFIRDRL